MTEIIQHAEDLSVCGTTSTANEGLAFETRSCPRGHHVAREKRNRIHQGRTPIHPGLRILVMSMHDESLYADRVLRAGGRGYIRKQEGGDKWVEAMRRVLRGEIAVSEKITGLKLRPTTGRCTTYSGTGSASGVSNSCSINGNKPMTGWNFSP